jgi:phosphate:Na+ symporter
VRRVGYLFTALIQSSSATTAIIIVMASQGFISLDAGIPLVMGANIGTCVTALLAAIGKPREAVRCAMVHTGLATTGVLMWLPFIAVIKHAVRLPCRRSILGAQRYRAARSGNPAPDRQRTHLLQRR